jgi:protein-disulfide isomerase
MPLETQEVEQNPKFRSVDLILLILLIISLSFNVLIVGRGGTFLNKVPNRSDIKGLDLSTDAITEIQQTDAPSLGRTDAPVTLVVFSDFQCVYCGRFAQALSKLPDDQKSHFRMIFRSLPLPIHPDAEIIAENAACVAKQDNAAFWELYEKNYAGQIPRQAAKDGKMIAYLTPRASVSPAALDACLSSGLGRRQVHHDMQLAAKYTVTATPTFFVDGKRILGGLDSPETIEQMVASELAMQSQLQK